jgi:hypothetical protein
VPKIQKSKKNHPGMSEARKRAVLVAIRRRSMFKSAIITYVMAVLFFIASFLFNGLYIVIPNPDETMTIQILEIVIKSGSLIFFFFFLLIAAANYQELRGYVLTWKGVLIFVVLTLIQATADGIIFLISAIGIVLILVYFFFIQGKLEVE